MRDRKGPRGAERGGTSFGLQGGGETYVVFGVWVFSSVEFCCTLRRFKAKILESPICNDLVE